MDSYRTEINTVNECIRNNQQHILQLLAETVEREPHDLTVHQSNNTYVVVAAANTRNQTAADALNAVAARLVHGLLRVHIGYLAGERIRYLESAPETTLPFPPLFAP